MNIAAEQLQDAIEMRDRARLVVEARKAALRDAETALGVAERHVASARARVQISAWADENIGHVEGVVS